MNYFETNTLVKSTREIVGLAGMFMLPVGTIGTILRAAEFARHYWVRFETAGVDTKGQKIEPLVDRLVMGSEITAVTGLDVLFRVMDQK